MQNAETVAGNRQLETGNLFKIKLYIFLILCYNTYVIKIYLEGFVMSIKKIGLFLFSLALCVSFAACGNGGNNQAAYDIYLAAQDKSNSVSSMEMKMSMDMTMEAEGSVVNSKMDGTAKQVMRSVSDIDMEMTMNIETMGMSMPATSYYKDGYVYTKVMDQKTKMAMPFDKFLKSSNAKSLEFPQNAVKKSNVENISGGKRVSFTIDGKIMNDILMEMMADSLSSLPGAENLTIDFGDIDYIMTVDNDNMLKSAVTKFDATFNMMGTDIKVIYDINMDIVSVNNTTVTFPSDLDSYIEQQMP